MSDVCSSHLAKYFELDVGVRHFQFLQGSNACGHGQRIATEGARLINRPEWRQIIHDLCPPPESSHRQTAPNYFSKASQVRPDSKSLLRAAWRETEASHDFVENEQGVVCFCNLAQEFQINRLGQIQAGVARN